ncbi:hypothetical protein [Leptospira noguchii]|uniref:Uncharacterized protein n=1 Tax=Leptospira noguchii serovar Autumnalis str. ZUN142 TaxID=1085540 RepID=M6UA55_9LEPT|nr:hypothetical protein [Leptospira noguchii]EMO41390.1 hypothetical protein LEP1GSC186_2136 [Leptospira noguchii serovar Autumnalis str. ZUN142]UOG58989.1 hypothetical protein MAL07_09050 [Leptospira noguchii]
MGGEQEIEFYTMPTEFVRKNHKIFDSGWEKLLTKNLDLSKFKDRAGFELVAKYLNIPHP